MQRAQRCKCAVNSLEVFVREFAGLEIQSRFIRPQLFRQSRKPSSTVRLFGTTSAFGIQRSSLNRNITSTAHSVEDALDAVSAPAERNSEVSKVSSHITTEDQKPDSLEPAKSRAENRQERRARRDKARKAQFEEAKRQEKETRKLAAAKEKRERRREARKIAATSQPSSATPSPSSSPSIEVTDESTAKAPVYKQRARLARRAAARAAANPGSVPVSAPTSAPSETRDMGKNAKKKARRDVAAPSGEAAQRPARQIVTTSRPSDVPSTRKSSETQEKQTRREEKKSKRTKARMESVQPELSQEAGEVAEKDMTKTEREAWMIQKAALQDKFGEQQWNPRKRISPDALAGIRTMHAAQPGMYSTEVLAHHFKVSPEAIRRILKSKWQPDEEAAEDRRKRWEKRGEKKWKEMVELGIRPPKKWREMGVGSVGKGETPAWKKGGGKGGERWIEQAETDSFVMAGDMAAERSSDGASIGDRIV